MSEKAFTIVQTGKSVAECLKCSSHHRVDEDKFNGHEWCPCCQETTNQIIVRKCSEPSEELTERVRSDGVCYE